MVWTATLSSKGQLVLPKAVRDRLGIASGSKVVFAEHGDHIEVHAYRGDILRWYGAQEVEGPQDWDALKREAGAARAREVMRETEGS